MTDVQNPSLDILMQYIKDLSVENPDAKKLLEAKQDDIQLGIDVQAGKVEGSEEEYESVIFFRLKIEKETQTLFLLELQYAGRFKISQASDEMLQLLLLVQCPHLLFPYLRAIVSNITQDSGLPALNLQPVDFLDMLKKKIEANAVAND